MVPGGLVVAALTDGPFLLAETCVHDVGGHFAVDLAPGDAQQQAVAGKGGDMSVGGNLGIAVDQVIAQQAVGAVVSSMEFG